MKNIILIGATILSQALCSFANENCFRVSEIEAKAGLTYLKQTGELLTGTVQDYYPDGQIKLHVELVDGMQHGKYIRWYDNGNKRQEVEFREGVIHTNGTFWHENGQISQIHGKDMIVGFYENGTKQRVIIYSNGKAVYSKEWNPDGSEKEYNKDG